MKRFLLIVCLLFGLGISAGAQDGYMATGLWDNWYGQLGLDMSLQNPYGTNFKEVFPKGKSFGADLAVGKWLTPEFGLRAKINLENVFLRSESAVWLNGFRKGYLDVVGDFQFDVLSILQGYQPDRRYTLTVYPRAGAVIAFAGTGSPLLGLGVGQVFHINRNWGIYTDVAYQMMTSVNGRGTDTGAGSNGYFDLNIGVQRSFGKQGLYRASEQPSAPGTVVLNSFWQNWYVQAGLGTSLVNPYGTNFLDVIPNGSSMGINLALGKWFTPTIAVRGGVNWQNGIIGNKKYTWMDAPGKPGSNHEGGGFVAAFLDLFLNVHDLFGGFNPDRFWTTLVYPRIGLDSNLEGKTGSPLAGLGMEQLFRLNNRLHLYVDFDYQVTSSEFIIVSHYTSNHKQGNSTGWFDINIGVQFDLGTNHWRTL